MEQSVSYLRSNLSATIKMVVGGEQVTVTHRGKPVAVINAYQSESLVDKVAQEAFRPVRPVLQHTIKLSDLY